MAGLQDVWVCAHDLQLIRADRIISLLIPVGSGYGAASPGDPLSRGTVVAEVDGGTEGDTLTRVKLADCGKSDAGELLADLARALGSASGSDAPADGGCLFVFAERDTTGRARWIIANRLPEAWPQSNPPDRSRSALTKFPGTD